MEPGLASPGVLSSRVDTPSSQTHVYARRLHEDAQLDEGTRTSASPPLNVASAAPSAAAPVVSAKCIETSGLQVRSIHFVVIVFLVSALASTVYRFHYDVVRNVSVQDRNWLHICLSAVARDPVVLFLVEVLRRRSFGRLSLDRPKNGLMSSWT